MPPIEIRYRRPPNRLDIFVHDLIVDGPELKVTLHDPSSVTTELRIGERLIYEPGAPLVWYVFPGAWYDVGRFHLCDGTFTGYYVNFITPVQLEEGSWSMFDLCLDLWVDSGGDLQILDQDEFDEAVDRNWIDATTAKRVREEAARISNAVRASNWPPAEVSAYDLETVRALRNSSS